MNPKDKTAIFKQELLHWNNSINLIAKSSEADIDNRHINQSKWLGEVVAQNNIHNKPIVDIGSGGGLPAIIMAINSLDTQFHLVESSSKKCAFLMNVKAKLELSNVKVHNLRIENFAFQGDGILTARACASLDKLLIFADILGIKDCYFLKGESVKQEIESAKINHKFAYELVYSEIYATFICKVIIE